MVVSLLLGSAPGMVVSTLAGISTLKPSAAVILSSKVSVGASAILSDLFVPAHIKNESHAKGSSNSNKLI
jgi:hypothetical protein